MSKKTFVTAVLAAFVLSACAPNVFELVPEEVTTRNVAPPGAAPGTCWGRDATPAVIETVTEQVILEEAENPVYQTETSQQIITPREDTWFETPCDDVMTPEFTSSVQRALQARGHYRGPITGRMDGRTQAAIRAYQKPQGLDSGLLSLAAARQMGLMQVDLEDAGIDVPEVAVAALDETEPQVTETASPAPVIETAAAAAARLAEEQAADRLAAIERAEEAERQAARDAEAAKITEAQAAQHAKAAQAQAAQEADASEKNKRAKELAQALEDEKARTGGTVFDPLPISSEGY
ncbi:MAG: peptidoglycan-binding domain-containing protein [Pseudomonadota bacterium]